MNAQIEKKDPEKLLQEIVTGISRMMDRKMDAIWVCIYCKSFILDGDSWLNNSPKNLHIRSFFGEFFVHYVKSFCNIKI